MVFLSSSSGCQGREVAEPGCINILRWGCDLISVCFKAPTSECLILSEPFTRSLHSFPIRPTLFPWTPRPSSFQRRSSSSSAMKSPISKLLRLLASASLLLFALHNAPLSNAQDADADATLATASISVDSIASRNGQWYACKCYPGDKCFPSSTVWTRFNTTVGGNLQVALPPGAPCYDNLGGLSTYDSAKCAEVQSNWSNEQWK